LNTKNKTILQYYKHGRKSGTAMAGPAGPPTTALSADEERVLYVEGDRTETRLCIGSQLGWPWNEWEEFIYAV